MAKKNVEELYKSIFSIKEALQDAVQLASESANIAQSFGGEIAKVITAQLNQYFIPAVSRYIDDENTPGAMSPLITFLDSVPLAMTRQEPEPEEITPAPIKNSLATPPGQDQISDQGVPAEGSYAAQSGGSKQESRNKRKREVKRLSPREAARLVYEGEEISDLLDWGRIPDHEDPAADWDSIDYIQNLSGCDYATAVDAFDSVVEYDDEGEDYHRNDEYEDEVFLEKNSKRE